MKAFRWLAYPLLLILGICMGLLAAAYYWSRSGHLLVPGEIVVQPPPQNATWCFPNTSLRGAVAVRTALQGRLHADASFRQADSSLVVATVRQLNDSAHHVYTLTLLRTGRAHYEILSQGDYGETMATEEGTFQLHRIPVRYHEKYDSLALAYFNR
ncbi:hypothetical protein [Hymenobacter guriensis]|uniref:Uncharacterized protein n=1 Tax=Hymenobacter guriensis TaxID=2793065 RepID=A0ABS0KW86_9BACT|nr:hypothetical protein [Hymenobacter guriensis]MBG8552101.1 hypothetical protein [Hymenobacter guriensis]